MKPLYRIAIVLVFLLTCSALCPAAAPPPRLVPDLRPIAARPGSEMAAVVRRYEADRGSLQRSYTILASPTRHARLKAFCEEWLAALEKLDSTRLSEQARKDLQALKKQVEGDKGELDRLAREHAAVAPVLPFAATIIDLEETRRRLEPVDSRSAARRVHELKKQIERTRQAIEAGKLPMGKTQVSRAAATAASLRGTLRSWFGYYNSYDPLFTWWLALPYQEADTALERYATFLREQGRRAADDATKVADRPAEARTVTRREPNVPDLGELLALPHSEMAGVIQRYRTDRLRLSPVSALPRGRGMRTPEGAARLKAFHTAWLEELSRLDFDRMGRDGQIDYLLLRNHLESELRRAGLPARPRPAAPDSSGIAGRPIGREALLAELAAELIPYSPEELITIADREMAWCEAEMKKASRTMGFGDDWLKAVEKVKTLHVEPGKQPEMIRDLAREAIDYLGKHGLVSVPALAAETWRMEMMSPQRQLVNPFFTGGEVISVSFPTAGMSYEAKLQSMRGNNIHFSRATVHHELIPGHHLQGFMTARYRPHRSMFRTPFWTEGWALYWEMVLYARGFPRTAEDRVGFLFWRMHRCARIQFSLGFHLGKLTPGECIDLLVRRVGHERDNATAEVRRSFAGSYGPLYQAAYMLGGLQIRAMRRELVESGKMPERAFHDAILRQGNIPIAFVRAGLTGQKLTRDYRPDWKFQGENPVAETRR